MNLNNLSIGNIVVIALIFSSYQQLIAQSSNVGNYQEEVNQIVQTALENDEGWERLTYFVDYFPGRLTGSEILEASIDWSLELLKADGFQNVYGQEVTIPKWVRGDEYVKMHLPYRKDLPMLGLGNSVGTYDGPIRVEAVVVRNFDELEQMSDQVNGKIVVYNMPWIDYGQTVQYKRRCAIEASKHGAVASLIRSVTPFSMQTPHTGPSRHEEGVKKIPHAALTVEDTKFLQRMQDRGETLELEIYMEAKTHPDSESRNVILQEIVNLLLPTIGINVESGWGAPDLTPLRNEGVPVAGLKVDD